MLRVTTRVYAIVFVMSVNPLPGRKLIRDFLIMDIVKSSAFSAPSLLTPICIEPRSPNLTMRPAFRARFAS